MVRTARRIWARELRDTYGAKNPKSWLMRFHTQTAGVSLTAQQPLNNIVRTAVEALAGVLGGTQSLHTNSFDEALALPTEDAVRIALRTQQIIAHETGIPNTIDPLGGSYFVEALTDRMEESCYRYFAKIDELGGMVEAVKRGFPQREIADAAFALQQEIDSGERVVVGVNRFTEGDDSLTPILRIDPALERKQVERLRAAKADRDGEAVEIVLAELKAAADGERNVMPAAARRRSRPRVRGRDRGSAAAGMGRLPRAAGLLAPALYRVSTAQALTPGAPYTCVKPTRRGPGACRSPASPRSCRTTSWTWRRPEAPIGSPFARHPPSVFTGRRPPISVAPLWIRASCSPCWQRPVSARCMTSAPDSVSCSWAMSTSSGPMPACSNAAAAASAVGEGADSIGIEG